MKKVWKIAATAALGTMLMAGTAMAADSVVPLGKNAANGAGIGLGQGVTRAYVGELLKLDEDALRDARRAGKSMVQIAEEQGVGAENLISAVVELRQAEMTKAVAAGKISEEQADLCLEQMEEKVAANMERVPEPPRENGRFAAERRGGGFGSSQRNDADFMLGFRFHQE